MPNAYVPLDALKSPGVLNITGTEHDERLLVLAETASRAVDRYCNRAFYVLSAAKRFDGSGGPRLLVPDLICVNRDGLRTDENGDGHPETNWAPDDFRLLPSNADSDSAGNPASRPYTAIEAAGERTRFPAGRGSVRVSGKWGWWRHLRPAGRTESAVAVAGETALELADGSNVRTGQTILVGAEQMYVEARQSNTLTVRRGVNGTARVGHDADTEVFVFEYPTPVVEAALTLAVTLWRRAGSAYDALDPARGGSTVAGMDPLAALMLAPYRKPAVGVGV